MTVKLFILVLLLLSELISNLATVNTNYGVKPSLHDLKLVRDTNTYTTGFSAIPTNYTSYNSNKISFENSLNTSDSLSISFLDVIKPSADPAFWIYQFNGFFSNPTPFISPTIIKEPYLLNTSENNLFVDAHIKFSIPNNTYIKALLINSSVSHSLRNFGICSQKNHFLNDNSQDDSPVLFPTTIYRLGIGLIILFAFSYKKRTYT
ncbi:MAG: hypothetical protein ACKE51_03915 [Methylococcaceae bacterium]